MYCVGGTTGFCLFLNEQLLVSYFATLHARHFSQHSSGPNRMTVDLDGRVHVRLSSAEKSTPFLPPALEIGSGKILPLFPKL